MTLAIRVVQQVFQEIGLEASEASDELEFSDLGVDAILSKHILSVVSEVHGVQLTGQVFENYPSIGQFKEYVENKLSSSKDHPVRARPPTSSYIPLSIVLHGNPHSSSTNVLLFPDGGGSAMAYAKLRLTSPNICLIGFNSPLLCDPQTPATTIEDLAAIWIDEVRRRQSKGPYILGGWSAGGYYAFEVAKRLLNEGDIVSKLILVDSPCRLAHEALPMEVVHYLSSKGLMGNWGQTGTPQWLLDHFPMTIRMVERYRPTPIDSESAPETFIIWAGQGIFDNLGAADTGLDLNTKVTKVLLEGRHDFGPDHWDHLLPGSRISTTAMSGNHFTVVHPPNCDQLSLRIDQVVQNEASGAWPMGDCCVRT